MNGHARSAAWVVLTFAGITMVAFNCWHALHSGLPEWPLAVLVGVAPVVLVMGMSHLVAAHDGGWFLKGVTFAAMLGAMALSVSATGYVVRPVLGALWWLYGAVVDSSAMVALQVIMAPREKVAVPAETDAVPVAVPAVPAVPVPHPELNGHAHAAAELFAADLAAGRVPGIRAIRSGMHVGQEKASQVQAYLRELT